MKIEAKKLIWMGMLTACLSTIPISSLLADCTSDFNYYNSNYSGIAEFTCPIPNACDSNLADSPINYAQYDCSAYEASIIDGMGAPQMSINKLVDVSVSQNGTTCYAICCDGYGLGTPCNWSSTPPKGYVQGYDGGNGFNCGSSLTLEATGICQQ